MKLVNKSGFRVRRLDRRVNKYDTVFEGYFRITVAGGSYIRISINVFVRGAGIRKKKFQITIRLPEGK